MNQRRYEITGFEWSTIAPLLPNKPRGVLRVDDRRVLIPDLPGGLLRTMKNRSALCALARSRLQMLVQATENKRLRPAAILTHTTHLS